MMPGLHRASMHAVRVTVTHRSDVRPMPSLQGSSLMNTSSSRRRSSAVKSALIACLMLLGALGSWGAGASAGSTTIPMLDPGGPGGGGVLGVVQAPREKPDICPELCRTPE
jgi:hypothetical protein